MVYVTVYSLPLEGQDATLAKTRVIGLPSLLGILRFVQQR